MQNIGKIEVGKTTRFNRKSSVGLSRAWQVLAEYMNAVRKSVPVTAGQQLKICPRCWIPGTKAENMGLNPRSKFCFACRVQLRDPGTGRPPWGIALCSSNEPIKFVKFRFCPYGGNIYKPAK